MQQAKGYATSQGLCNKPVDVQTLDKDTTTLRPMNFLKISDCINESYACKYLDKMSE